MDKNLRKESFSLWMDTIPIETLFSLCKKVYNKGKVFVRKGFWI